MFSGLHPTELIIVLVSIVISMALHEAMHGFTAYWLGDKTAAEAGRLTLNPLRHIDMVTTVLLPMLLILVGLPPFFAAKPVPFDPRRVKGGEYGAALVGIAGPLTNLFLAIIAAMILRISVDHLSTVVGQAFLLFIEVNIAFFVFNMVPFPPLDGSRLVYAFAPEPLQELMARIESFGFFPILIFVLFIFQFIAPLYSSIVSHILNLLLG